MAQNIGQLDRPDRGGNLETRKELAKNRELGGNAHRDTIVGKPGIGNQAVRQHQSCDAVGLRREVRVSCRVNVREQRRDSP